MKDLINKLIVKHLLKDITRITLKVCGERFDDVFNESCSVKSDRNTTIGYTFEKIQLLALNEVLEFMSDKLNNISLTKAVSEDNPFRDVLWDLWWEAKECFGFCYSDYIESILVDEWHDKQVELTKAGILDEDGDYIKQ